MTRIVGGVAGGRRLDVPGSATRPTADRVREALFSTLTGLLDLDGARVLDLFAGSGAVGLEAASRGAAQVTLVDSGRAAVASLKRNAELVAPADVVISQLPVETFLAAPVASLVDPVSRFDLVFADPPYAYPDTALASMLGQLATADCWLAPAAIVVVERSARSAAPQWPIVIQPVKDKRYGDTVLWYGQRT